MQIQEVINDLCIFQFIKWFSGFATEFPLTGAASMHILSLLAEKLVMRKNIFTWSLKLSS